MIVDGHPVDPQTLLVKRRRELDEQRWRWIAQAAVLVMLISVVACPWLVEPLRPTFAAINVEHKEAPSFADMLAGIRREIWTARFSAQPVFKRVSGKIRRLLPRWFLAA